MPAKKRRRRKVSTIPKKSTKRARKAASGKRRSLVVKVLVPQRVDLQGPELGALDAQQRLDIATMGCKRSTAAPQWASDDKLWRAAVRTVAPHWKRYEYPYAAVAFVFLRMGGSIRATRASAPAERTLHRPRSSAGVSVERIELDELGYDPHGKYWGVGEPLWRVSSEHPYVDQVVRARTMGQARQQVMQRYQH